MQKLDWLDVLDIAIELNELYPEIDPQWISFPDLHKKICDLENFCGDQQNQMKKFLKQFNRTGLKNINKINI